MSATPVLPGPASEPGRGPVRRRLLTVRADDGTPLGVRVDGEPGAPVTVVLAHGWTLTADSWLPQARALTDPADGAGLPPVRVVRYDQRGHGRSGPGTTLPWTIDLLGADLARILAETAPAGPVVLGGHSMGGMTIMALAAARPELFGDRVAGVLLAATSAGRLDAAVHGSTRRVRAAGRAQAAFFGHCARVPDRAERIRRRLPGPGGRISPALVRWGLFGPDAPADAVRATARMIHATPMATVAGYHRALMRHDKAGSLQALAAVPVHVVVGARDRLTPVCHSRRLAEALPQARLHVEPGCGHMVQLERPEVVTARLRELCAAALGAAGPAPAGHRSSANGPGRPVDTEPPETGVDRTRRRPDARAAEQPVRE